MYRPTKLYSKHEPCLLPGSEQTERTVLSRLSQAKVRPVDTDTQTLNIHVVVPVKDLARAKSRLADVLSPDERRTLVLKMLQRVLTTMQSVASSDHNGSSNPQSVWIEKIRVISADATVRDLANSLGAQPLLDLTVDLNAALERARTTVIADGAAALLIIPADVAAIMPADMQGLTQALAFGADMVIAPDQLRIGTNALGLRLPSLLHFQFGPDSFAEHMHTAQRLGLATQVYTSPTLALDIDTPEDLDLYKLQEHIWQL